ncbi:uncharacterized protein [Antedon mediterranea]|uniref:uncharacterized protein n=1 Tax=Antedon mediterranea TaxID=105859 RepID=UPI003AF7474F
MDNAVIPKDMIHLDALLPNGVPLLSLDVLQPLLQDNQQVKLGKGAFGEVLLCRLGGENGELVAVKRCLLAENDKIQRCIDKLQVSIEARTQMMLSAEICDVFPRVYGTCTYGTSDGIIMEFIGDSSTFETVTLYDVITKNMVHLSLTDGFHCALDIAIGIKILQTFGLIHNDLASRNILLHKFDHHWAAKITDFGCVCSSAVPYDVFQLNDTPPDERTGRIIKYREYAPERFYPESPPTFASDIYSLGIIIVNIADHVNSNFLRCVGKLCSSADPKDRPRIEYIEERLLSGIKCIR